MGPKPRIRHAGAGRSAIGRASKLAQRQFGPVARWQLLELGCTRSRIEHWRRSGRLHSRYPGVYVWGRPDTGTEGDLAAALLLAGHGAALAGLTALWWLGFLQRRPDLIHVDAPGRRASRADVKIRHQKPVERRWHRSLPHVPIPAALLIASADLSHDSLRLVLARAEFKRVLVLSSLQETIRDGRRGTRALRAAMDAHLPQLAHCANALERDFVLLCERSRLPLPEPNQRLGRYRPDMLWANARLIVELDGKGAHSTPAQLVADARRQADLEAWGYTVLRFTWAEVQFESERVASIVRRHLT